MSKIVGITLKLDKLAKKRISTGIGLFHQLTTELTIISLRGRAHRSYSYQ